MLLNEEARVFIQGRVSAEDDRASKLILEKIRLFDDIPREVWIQFDNKAAYWENVSGTSGRPSPVTGQQCGSHLSERRKSDKETSGWLSCDKYSLPGLNQMCEKYGQTNVKVVERGLKNL